MKRLILSNAILILLLNNLYSQNYSQKQVAKVPTHFFYGDIKIGAFFPQSLPLGVRFGLAGGMPIDDVVSINISFDYFRSQLENTNVFLKTFNLIMFFVNTRIDSPFYISPYFQPFLQFGIGYEILVENYRDLITNTNIVYGDVGVNIQAGFKVELGEKTDMFIMCEYNICNVTKLNIQTYDNTAKQILNGFSIISGISLRF